MNPLEKQAIETMAECAKLIGTDNFSITSGMRVAFYQMKLLAEAARFAHSHNVLNDTQLERLLEISEKSANSIGAELGLTVSSSPNSAVHLKLVPDAPNG